MFPVDEIIANTRNRAHFSTTIPGLQTSWDNTSLTLFKSCPYKYYLTMILGYGPKETPAPLFFGIAFHSAIEYYDKLIHDNIPYKDAQEKTVQKIFELTEETAEVDLIVCEHCNKSQVKDAVKNNCVHCQLPMEDTKLTGTKTISKIWTSDDSARTRQTLTRSILWYTIQYKNDFAKTVTLPDGKPALELSFSMGMQKTSPEGNEYTYCGHIDKIIEFSSQHYILDRKTTKYQLDQKFFDKYKMDNQMTGYILAGKVVTNIEVAGAIIDGIQLGAGFNRYQRGIVKKENSNLEEWLYNTHSYFDLAENYASSQHWPMNESSCDMYGGCEFREFCAKLPSMRKKYLDAAFIKKYWNPLEER